jgi:multiple sugar transport system permease protein
MKSLSRRFFLLAAFAVALSLLGSSVSPVSSSAAILASPDGGTESAHGAPPANASRTLRVWTMGEEGKKFETLARLFEAENPGAEVIVQAIPWGAAHAKLVTAVVGRIPPDVAQMGTTWMPEFHAMGALEKLEGWPGGLDPARYFPGAWETVAYPDGVYGLPWYVETRCLYWRRDLLRAAGFNTAPATWEDLLAAGAALSARSGLPGTFGISLPPNDMNTFCAFGWQAGGEILDDEGRPAVESPAYIRGIAFYVDLFKKRIAPIGEQADVDPVQGFADGTMPMFISGPWSIHRVEEIASELNDDDWGIAPLPAGVRSASFMGGCDLVIFKDGRNKELARKFLEFAARPATQVAWFRASDCLPPGPEAWEDPVLRENPRLMAFREQLKTARPTPMVPEWEQISAAMNREMEKAVRGVATPENAARKMGRAIAGILKARAADQSPVYKLMVLGGAGLLLIALLGIYFFRPLRVSSRPEIGGLDITEHSGSARWLAFFLAPALSLLAVFFVLPVIGSFLISLTDWDIYSVTDWRKVHVVGLRNYGMILEDPLFWKSVRNTLIFSVVGGPLTIAVALGMALTLERIRRGAAIFRTGFFLPVVTTMVAVAVVWRWIYHPRFGLLNAVLIDLGGVAKDWLADPELALGCLIAMAIWKNFGYSMVIFIAGLQGIPRSYYEAAEIDGAGPFERFTSITIPLLAPTFLLVTILTTIGYLQFFAEPYVMTDGGPLDATLSVALYLYQKGFKFYLMGEAAAISYLLFVLIFLIAIGQLYWARRQTEARA